MKSNTNAVQTLDVGWHILPDPDNTGKLARWFDAVPDTVRAATVPGTIQQAFPDYHGVAWYWLKFES